MALSDRDRKVIRAAAGTYRDPGGELEALAHASWEGLTRAYQILNNLFDDPAAWEAEPVAMGMLRRKQEARQRLRSVQRAAATRAGRY